MTSPQLSRRTLVGAGAAGLAGASVSAGTASAARPRRRRPANILLITLDDLGARTPSSFGGRPGLTPHLDRLVSEGTAFDRAHVPVSLCQPSRSALMSGLYPHRNGAEGFGPVDADVPLLTDALRERGYRLGILSKVDHLAPIERYGWDLAIASGELGAGRAPAAYAAAAQGFFAAAQAAKQPFFLMVNSDDPHRPFAGSPDEQTAYDAATRATISAPSQTYDAASVAVPGFLPDLPAVRTELAQYESSTRRADDTVGAVLAQLEAAGLAEDTVVVVLGDNGMAFPFAKAGCYVQSTQTSLVVRWPGVARKGRREGRAFVSTLDLMPTLLRAADARVVPERQDGRDLHDLLRGRRERGRGELHTVFHETGAGARYDMRGVLDDRWSYVWNPWSDGTTTFQVEYLNSSSWQAMVAAGGTDPTLRARTDFFLRRAPEELYDLRSDPHSTLNLAGSPAAGKALAAARRSTARWMREYRDPLRPAYLAAVPTAA